MNKKEELSKQFFSTMSKVKRIVDKTFTVSSDAATFLQLEALEYLAKNPKSTVGELASELHMSSPAIAQLTDRMVSAKLIVRETDRKDRRVIRLSLSKTGEQEVQAVPKVIQEKMSKAFSHMPEADLRELIRIFNNLLSNLEEKKYKE